MKAMMLLLVLTGLALSTKTKSLHKELSAVPKSLPNKKDLPKDILISEQFLKKSAIDFDQIQKISAVKAIQNSVASSALDLNVPHLESPLNDEGLTPVRNLNNSVEVNTVDQIKEEQPKNARELSEKNPEELEENDDEDNDDKLTDIEKRLYSIEDKVDHLLVHSGHDLTPHNLTMTPWGASYVPNFKGQNSINQKLKMVDYLYNPGMNHGMGHGMGYGMGHGMGYHSNHMLGLGHANPLGYGLGHLYPGYHPADIYSPFHGLYGGYHGSYGGYHGAYGGYHGGIGGYHSSYHGMGDPYFGLHSGSHYHGGNYHEMYGGHHGIGGGYNRIGRMHPFSQYRNDLEDERVERYKRHQRDMDDIMNKPLLPPSFPKPETSSSLFLI